MKKKETKFFEMPKLEITLPPQTFLLGFNKKKKRMI